MKIGILDGNPNILASVADTLQVSGHTVSMHTIGASLLEALFPPARRDDPLPYDLVLLDLLLPGTMSGADIFLFIRRMVAPEQLPMILMLATDEQTSEQLRRLLPDEVPLLRKPFHPPALLQLIAQSKRT